MAPKKVGKKAGRDATPPASSRGKKTKSPKKKSTNQSADEPEAEVISAELPTPPPAGPAQKSSPSDEFYLGLGMIKVAPSVFRWPLSSSQPKSTDATYVQAPLLSSMASHQMVSFTGIKPVEVHAPSMPSKASVPGLDLVAIDQALAEARMRKRPLQRCPECTFWHYSDLGPIACPRCKALSKKRRVSPREYNWTVHIVL